MSKKHAMVAAIIATSVLCAAYFLAPRRVVVLTRVGPPAGVRVSIIDDTPGFQTALTDSSGVAAFGRGPWTPLIGERRVIALKIERDGTTILDDLRSGPRWGPIHVYIP